MHLSETFTHIFKQMLFKQFYLNMPEFQSCKTDS